MTKLITQKANTKLAVSLKNYLLSCKNQTNYLTCLLILLFSGMGWGQSTANYNFTVGTSTLNNMTGSTSIMNGIQDDLGSTVFPIGFNFIYMGTSYSHISVNSNGQARLHTSSGATAISGSAISSYSSATVTIAPMAGDNQVGNGMSYLVTGSAPNRKLIIEWNKFYVSLTDVNSGNMQLVLYEGTGVFEFIYGNIVNSASSTRSRSIFHSSGSTSNTSAFITVGTTPTINTTATSPIDNNFAASVAIANLANRMFTFTPPIPVSGPTNLTFTNVSASSMTLNWTAATPTTGIVRYVVQRSADGGITYPVSTNVALGTNTLVVTGLSPSTSYTYRVVAVSEGVESAPASASQSTNAPTTYTWIATSGTASWVTPTSWSPDRTTPDATDILNFSNGGSSIVTSIPTQTVGNIVFSNNTTANFQAASTATLTSGGLTIPSGSTLMSNGTTAALTIAFSSGAVNTIGGRLEISNTGTPANGITFANSVTTITSAGTLAAGGSVAATVTGTTSTLVINGTYEHNYTTVSGTIPTATWAATSNLNINSFTSNTSLPTGLIGQTFGNLTWNCTAQTGNISLGGNSITCAGTFTMTSTNTGSLRLGASLNGVIATNNFIQTGGTIDCSSSTGSSIIRVSGTFNQSGGTITETGTGSGNIEFNGVLAQSVTLGGTISNTINYRINNNAGITLSGTMAITTGAGLRISSTAATPISGGTLTYTGNTTLTYDASSGAQTVTANEFPWSNGPNNLTINNTSTSPNNVVTIPFDRTVNGTLTMTSGDINISSNNLTLGTSTSALGTLSYTAGAIRVTSGTLTRWFGTSGLPTSAPTSGIGFYPLASNLNNRNVGVFFSTATVLSSGGTITIGHTDVAGLSTLTSFTDAGYNVDTRTNASWTVTTGNGIATSGTLGMRLTGAGACATPTVANLRLMQANVAAGVHAAGTGTTPNFQANRTGLSLTDIANTHYIGAGNADIQTVFSSVASGDWNNPATWDVGSVPTCTGNVTIMNGHNVSVNSASNVSRNLTVNPGGTLSVASGDLTVGCTLNNTPLTNNGTLTVSGGTLNVNGNIVSNLGSTFNQSGGNINIDGNAAGNATNSVASGTALLQFNQLNSGINLTGGTLTVVDPHANATSTLAIGYSNSTAGGQTSTINHTLRLGDGISTDAGGNVAGFRVDPWTGTAYLSFGNIIINGGSGINRSVTIAQSLAAIGDVTVTTGSTLNLNSTPSLIVAGNVTVNSGGTFINTASIITGIVASNTSSLLTFGPSTLAQTIGGSGTYQNLATSPTANLNSLSINNSNATGVTISIPLSISGTLTMTAGKINTTATNLLTLGTSTAAGTLSYTAGQIAGPFARTFATSSTSTASYDATTLFPVGDGTNYLPIHIDPVNGAGPVVMRGQAFNSNSGSAGIGMASPLSNDRWEALVTTSGSSNLTSCFIGLNDAQIATGNVIAQSASAAGFYNAIAPVSTVAAGASIRTATAIPAASYTGFFTYGSPSVANTWTGTTSSSWNTASNWSLNTVPTATDDVLISSNGTTPPVLDVDITIPAGKSLTLSGTGSLTVAPGKVLTIAGTANFGARPVIFKSDATGTAMLGSLTGTLTGASNVTVERFIPSGKRAFRLLSPAVTTTNFISGNWQGQTHITGGLGTTGLGFDATETNNPSMFTYNNQAAQGVSGWIAIANTNATNLTAGVGYRMLVRGDRTASNITAASADSMNTAVTLSATGTLRTGAVTLNSSSTPSINNTSNTTTADYSLIGNPYQSAVDWNAVTKSGIDATYWAWDPNMGTTAQRGRYVSFNGTVNSVDGGVGSSNVGQFIQPGQAFFVKNTVSGTAGALTFQEAHKATTNANVFRTANPTTLTVSLYDPNELAIGGYPIDAMKAVFSADYTNELGLGDAAKLEAAGENIAWFRNNIKLAIEAAAPATSSDELVMKTIRLGANKNYTFKINTTNFDADLTPYLVDNFLNTQTQISTSEGYLANFSTTSNVASYGEDRFKIVFQNTTLSTDDFANNIKLYPNPAKAGASFYLDGITEATVSVYNVVGQNIPVTVMSQGNATQVTPTAALSQGVYLITVTTAGKTAQVKWIVE